MRKYLLALVAAVATVFAVALPASASAHPSVIRGAVQRAYAATAVHGTNETAVTRIILRPDGGVNGTWAYDDMTRSAHIVRGAKVSGTFCGLSFTHACYAWSGTITDSSASMQTIIGENSPGLVSKPLLVAERGTFTGTATFTLYDTYANAFPGDVPVSENDNGNLPTGDHTTTAWAEQFFGGAGFPTAMTLPTWSWSYTVATGADSQCSMKSWHWLDGSTTGGGDTSGDGNIFAPNASTCAATSST